MIDFIRGKVVHREEDYVVMDVGPIGYRVFCPNPYQIGKDGAETIVYTHHHVREDAILLYGFSSRDEQALFRTLLDVSGIGPRVALGILAAGNPSAIVASIQQENIVYLTKLPGIGRKTAQRIILDLKDKMGSFGAEYVQTASGDDAMSAAEPTGATPWSEAKQGLIALGYTETETAQAFASIRSQMNDTDTVDSLIKKALKSLLR